MAGALLNPYYMHVISMYTALLPYVVSLSIYMLMDAEGRWCVCHITVSIILQLGVIIGGPIRTGTEGLLPGRPLTNRENS